MSEGKKSNIAVRILKIAGKALLAMMIVMGVLVFCAVKFLNSKYLTEMVERVANDNIDGKLSVGEIRLGFSQGFPLLSLEVEDISVISHAFDSLSVEQRGQLPAYADSLLSLDYLAGSLNVKRLVMDNELELHDVELRGLAGNLVIARNGKASYDIVKMPSGKAKSKKNKLPGIRIDKFSLTRPKEMRFFNAADSLAASVLLLTDAAINGDGQPTYQLKINGNIRSPKATVMTNLDKISFGLDGKIYWTPEHPGVVAIDEMELRGAFLSAVVSGEIDFENDPIVNSASVDLAPVALTDILSMLPDSVRDMHRLRPPYFSTDLAIGGRFELSAPMNLAVDTLPSARISLRIPPATLRYGKARFEEIALDARMTTVTNMPDSIVIEVDRCVLAGPATRLEASAVLSTLFSDPSFTADILGSLDLDNLPPLISGKIPGCLRGVLTADLHASGSASLFKPERIHRLIADGKLSAAGVYFLSADTSNLVQVSNASIDFDSRRIIDKEPVLGMKIQIDTATVLTGGVDLAFRGVNLSVGADDKQPADDSELLMTPLAGDLKVSSFNVTTVTNGSGAHISNISGHVGMRQTAQKGFMPHIVANLLVGGASAGSLSDRVLLNNTAIKATLYKAHYSAKPKKPGKASPQDREYAYIKPVDVYKYVIAKRRHRKHIRRVYGDDLGAHDEEMLVWNLNEHFSRFLNEWRLRGSVKSGSARLLTPLFPLQNKISALSLNFSNDTVDIKNISLIAGHSDITLSGQVTNVSRAMTDWARNSLKANLSLISDNIDVNEIAASVFTGASYASEKRQGRAPKVAARNDDALQARLDTLSKIGPGRSSPVLIPVNLDAQLRVTAKQLLYGDIAMQDMGCDLLVYDGAVSLHDMRAASDAGSLNLSALYSAPRVKDMHFGFGMELDDFNIAKFVKLVPAIDSITPLIRDFSGMIGADMAATCRLDSGMNIDMASLNAAIKIHGDNLAFIDPEKYRKLGKWLGFKDKADNTIHSLNVEMTVADGIMHVYPFAFNIDRYRLGIYGYNDIAMNFDYHLSVLKSPLPFKFGITIKGNPKKYKVRFGGAKFNEKTAIESVNIVNNARINLIDQLQSIFKRGVSNSKFAGLQIAYPEGYDDPTDPGLTPADSLRLFQEGLIDTPPSSKSPVPDPPAKKPKKRKRFLFF